jgi:uncharacterized membrane protein
MRFTSRFLILLFWFISTGFTGYPSQKAETAVVQAALFYSPACGHCHYVIEEILPPLMAQYGDQFQIVGIDVSTPDGFELFKAAWTFYDLEGSGVPFLVIGDRFLIGSVDIPEQLPGLINMYLAQGGVGLPPIPGLSTMVQKLLVVETPTAQQTTENITPGSNASTTPEIKVSPTPGLIIPPMETLSIGDRISRDLLGNSLAIIVLCAMIFTVGIAVVQFKNSQVVKPKKFSTWLFPLLCLTGLAVAGYLAYVESSNVEAVCGPVGDCNTVQQSEYARLFGVLHIGVLGMIGFILILIASMVQQNTKGRESAYAVLTILVMTTFGVLFSIYLTFLEPFVIGATCAWCLASAIIMTILFWLSLEPGKKAVSLITKQKKQKYMIPRRKRRY